MTNSSSLHIYEWSSNYSNYSTILRQIVMRKKRMKLSWLKQSPRGNKDKLINSPIYQLMTKRHLNSFMLKKTTSLSWNSKSSLTSKIHGWKKNWALSATRMVVINLKVLPLTHQCSLFNPSYHKLKQRQARVVDVRAQNFCQPTNKPWHSWEQEDQEMPRKQNFLPKSKPWRKEKLIWKQLEMVSCEKRSKRDILALR